MLYLKINSSYVSPPPSNWEVTVMKQWTSTFSWWFISPTKNLVKKNKDFLSLFLGKKWPNSKERTKQTNETFLLMYISCCYWSLAIKTEQSVFGLVDLFKSRTFYGSLGRPGDQVTMWWGAWTVIWKKTGWWRVVHTSPRLFTACYDQHKLQHQLQHFLLIIEHSSFKL